MSRRTPVVLGDGISYQDAMRVELLIAAQQERERAAGLGSAYAENLAYLNRREAPHETRDSACSPFDVIERFVRVLDLIRNFFHVDVAGGRLEAFSCRCEIAGRRRQRFERQRRSTGQQDEQRGTHSHQSAPREAPSDLSI